MEVSRLVVQLRVLALALVLSTLLSACGGGSSTAGEGEQSTALIAAGVVASTPFSSPAMPSRIVTDNVTTLLTPNEITSLRAGDQLWLRLNRTGTTVEEVPCTFHGYDAAYGGYRLSTARPFGPGDSGSPIVADFGAHKRVLGAIWQGPYANRAEFVAQPMADMVGMASQRLIATKATSGGVPLLRSVVRYNLPPALSLQLQDQLGLQGTTSPLTVGPTKEQRTRTPITPVTPVNGHSVYVFLAEGDIFEYGLVGSLSLVTEGYTLAFGHNLITQGVMALPTFLARAIGLDERGKLAESTGQALGALTVDSVDGVLIDPAVVATTSDWTVTVVRNGTITTARHTIANHDGTTGFLRDSVVLASVARPLSGLQYGTVSVTVSVQKGGQLYPPRVLTVTHTSGLQHLPTKLVEALEQQVYPAFDGVPGEYQEVRIDLTVSL